MINMIRGPEDYEWFLYGDSTVDELVNEKDRKWVDAVQKALGFRLFFWQKVFLYNKDAAYGRRTGKTLAVVLQALKGTEPIDVTPETMRSISPRIRCMYKMLIDVARKLDEHKVPHAPVCRTEKELNHYIYTIGRSIGKYPRIEADK